MKEKIQSINPDDAELIRKAMATQHLTPSLIVDPSQKENQKTLDLEKRARRENGYFQEGYDLFIKEIQKRAIDGLFVLGEDVTPVPVGSFEINETTQTDIRSIEFWEDYVEYPDQLQQLLGYSNEMLLNLYNLATLFYENKQYKEAAAGYKFLCIVNPAISSFWLGLGLALESNNELDEGMKAFEKGIESSPSEFTSYLGVIRCSEKLKNFDRAIELLTRASENTLLEEDAKAALEYIATVPK